MASYWLESATIDGFRNIRNLQLEGLGGLNVLVGENNSGKTSVLEALSVLANFSDPSEWLKVVGRRDFGRLDETRPESIRWCFDRARSANVADTAFDATCQMSCSGDLGIGTLHVRCHDILAAPSFANGTRESPPELESDESETNRVMLNELELDVPETRRGVMLTHYGDIRTHHSLFTDLSPEPLNLTVWEDDAPIPYTRGISPIATETLNPYSYQINRLQVRRLSGGRLRNLVEPLLSLLRTFDPEILDIDIASVRGGRPSIYIHHRRLGSAPLSIFGDALRRAVLLATTILTFRNGGILFVDEIETGIHVHAIQQVFSWLSSVALKRRVQVFVTTHSLEAVDAIVFSSPEARNEVVAFHLDQKPDRTTAKRFDGELLSRLRRERGIDVR